MLNLFPAYPHCHQWLMAEDYVILELKCTGTSGETELGWQVTTG